jgi:hypothetical protein
LLEEYYESSMKKALESIYPDSTFEHSERNWNDDRHHRILFDQFARKLQINDEEDWYHVSQSNMTKFGLTSIVNDYYDGSIGKALNCIYPEISWDIWRFEGSKDESSVYFEEIQYRRYLDWIAEDLELDLVSDWFEVSYKDLEHRGGGKMLDKWYHSSLPRALKCIYSDTSFYDAPISFWKEITSIDRYLHFIDQLSQQEGNSSNQQRESILWRSSSNRRIYFDWISEELQIERTWDWYYISNNDIQYHGGKKVLSYYEYSMDKALMSIYPHTQWQPWRFHSIPKNYWDDRANISQYMDWIEDILCIDTPMDWYGCMESQLQSFHGSTLLNYFGGLIQVISNRYPHIQWDITKWNSMTRLKSQSYCLQLIRSRTEEQLQLDANHFLPFHHHFTGKKSKIQSDIWIPRYNISIEYQGRQHYEHNNTWGDGLSHQMLQDIHKKRLLQSMEITLIHIPFWWNFELESLLSTISKVCKPPIVLHCYIVYIRPFRNAMHLCLLKVLITDTSILFQDYLPFP